MFSLTTRFGNAFASTDAGGLETPSGLAFLVATFAVVVCGVVWVLLVESHAVR